MALHGSGAVGANNLLSGSYTPTLTAVSNVSASTTGLCVYSRVGDVVTVSGAINVTATAAGASTVIGISLPIPSNIGGSTDLGGCAASAGVQQSAGIDGDLTNDRAQMRYISVDTGARGMFFSFCYRVLP